MLVHSHVYWDDVTTDNVEDEKDSDDEQNVFDLEGKTGQELQEQMVQTLDEAAADPAISRGGWEGAAATQDAMPVASTSGESWSHVNAVGHKPGEC